MDRITEWVMGLLIAGLSTVIWFMFKDHHKRIQACERSNISRDDVNALVSDVEEKFHRDHHQILDTMTSIKHDLREDLKALREDIRLIYERRSSSRD